MGKFISPQVYNDCNSVLEQSIVAVEHLDSTRMRELANRTTHNASVFQDNYSVKTGLVIHGVAALIQAKLIKSKQINFSRYIGLLDKLRKAVQNKNEHEFNVLVEIIFDKIKDEETDVGKIYHHFQTKARLNKSARLYAHGLSAGRAAEVAGVTQWQLYSYIGKSSIDDDGSDSVVNMKKRLKHAMRIFGNARKK